jgi:hypothetical protein
MKTSELTGHALNWAVAKCEGTLYADGGMWDLFCPSTEWEFGGPIIEREDIAMSARPDGLWAAYAPKGTRLVQHGGQAVEVFNWTYKQQGNTALIAAMRCYVASKLGDEVEIPEELL